MPNRQSMNYGLEAGPVGMGIRSATISLSKADFTDATTTGKYTWEDAIPAFSYAIGTKCTVNSAFSGDTSAVLTAGKTDGEDEYTNGSSLVVFTAATVGVEVESPLDFVVASTDVYLVVTTNSDFTLVPAAANFDLEIFYLSTVQE